MNMEESCDLNEDIPSTNIIKVQQEEQIKEILFYLTAENNINLNISAAQVISSLIHNIDNDIIISTNTIPTILQVITNNINKHILSAYVLHKESNEFSSSVLIVHCLLKSLINLTANSISNLYASIGIINNLILLIFLTKKSSKIHTTSNLDSTMKSVIETCIILLSNLTTLPDGALAVVNYTNENSLFNSTTFIKNIVDTLVNNKFDPSYQFISNILNNISTNKNGRDILYNTNSIPLLAKLISYNDNTSSISLIIKLGIFGMFWNLCSDLEKLDFLISEELGLVAQLLSYLLTYDSKLTYKEDEECKLQIVKERKKQLFDKQISVERVPKIQKIIIDILDFLVKQKEQRIYLRDINTYPILRDLHLVEKEESVLCSIEDIVTLLVLDENTNTSQ